jgi:hypothetical protein
MEESEAAMTDSFSLRPSTTEATAALTQSREEDAPGSVCGEKPLECGAEGRDYTIGAGVKRAPVIPYERASHEPLYRPLKIYTIDPATRRSEASQALVNVPYEPLAPGPEGCLFQVDSEDESRGARYSSADLEDRFVLIRNGYDPSPSDPRFHQQMVYAVSSNVYATFRKALGRHISWGFGQEGKAAKLRLKPHAFLGKNAYYDNVDGQVLFGYYRAEPNPTDRTLPGGYVSTCLCHDIITHEVTHALLDGLRAHFRVPSSPDVTAFHEAFADLVAIFQRFSYKEVVRNAIRTSHGDIGKAQYLTDLARQFGNTTGRRQALRKAIDESNEITRYEETMEPHQLGSVLVAAVFEAFLTVLNRKTARYMRLATQGSGILPPGEISPDLLDVLSEEASRLAGQFLSICIRAIDYCPPVDLQFGEYLRAMITADYDLIPDDPWNYREALIDAFMRRNIYPRFVNSLSEDALLWRPPRQRMERIDKLSFAELRFKGDPGCSAGQGERLRQACVLGNFLSGCRDKNEFGIVAPDDPRLDGDRVGLPCVESVRSARRVGPAGQIVFDLVAEITQERIVRPKGNMGEFRYHGGSTVILGPEGEIRYLISKSVVGTDRLERRRRFILGERGQRFWKMEGGEYVLKDNSFKLLSDAVQDNDEKAKEV